MERCKEFPIGGYSESRMVALAQNPRQNNVRPRVVRLSEGRRPFPIGIAVLSLLALFLLFQVL